MNLLKSFQRTFTKIDAEKLSVKSFYQKFETREKVFLNHGQYNREKGQQLSEAGFTAT